MEYFDSDDEYVMLNNDEDFNIMLEEYNDLTKLPMKIIIGRK